jgi:putative ABC transport system permease protein
MLRTCNKLASRSGLERHCPAYLVVWARNLVIARLARLVIGAIGVCGTMAFVVARLFTSLVFGVQSTNPMVYAAVAFGLAALGVLAALVPARRAARLDPLATLRAE